ncbi:MAG: immunoglobulin-like domain-containing protein [Minisyncoccia bacterium]
MKSNNFIKKNLVIVALLLSFLVPQKSHAYAGVVDVVIDPAHITKSVINGIQLAKSFAMFAANTLAWRYAKSLVQDITGSTVNWINSGFEGNPAYITDPSQFFLDIADDTAGEFLSGTRLNVLCTPFRGPVRLALLNSYLRNTNNQQYACTLSKILNNYDAFTNDFSVGGWDGWFEVTQSTGGNPYYVALSTQNEMLDKVASEQTIYKEQSTQSGGFLSMEKCRPEDTVTAGNQAAMSAKFGRSLNVGDCTGKKEVVTPGSVIADQLNTQLPTGVRSLELADSLGEIINAAISMLTTKILGPGQGLRGLTGQLPPGASSSGFPVLDVTGDNPVTHYLGTFYEDARATAIDMEDGDITSRIVTSGGVNYNTIGTYKITYSVTNSRGNTATAVRTVIVRPFQEPGAGTGETCVDGIKNQDETGIDTGGICGSGTIATCSDGIRNQDETGIDVGGICGIGSSAPVITSISPTGVLLGVATTMTITGNNLTSSVQFTDSTGKVFNVTGTVINGGTQTRVSVPTNLAPNVTTLKVLNGGFASNAVSFIVTVSPTCVAGSNEMSCVAPNQANLVSEVIKYLISKGQTFNINNSCDFYEITKRVAWALRSTDGGLLTSPGSGCNANSVVMISYIDNSRVKILFWDNNGLLLPGSVRWDPFPQSNDGSIVYIPPVDPGDPANACYLAKTPC